MTSRRIQNRQRNRLLRANPSILKPPALAAPIAPPATPATATPEPISVTPTEHAPIPARRRILPGFVVVLDHAGLLSGLKSASEAPQVSQENHS
jgi:hypothetical protein